MSKVYINWEEQINKIAQSKSKKKKFKFANKNSANSTRWRLLQAWDGIEIERKGSELIVSVR